MALGDYVSIGRSGLKVSRLGLGTNMFGTQRGWGISEPRAAEVFHRFLERGGNLIDTANIYTNGESERILGRLISKPGVRDRVVLSTKFSYSVEAGNPNAEGNGRKNLHRSLEESLQRLNTPYIDLYWLHFWDEVTPAEEVVTSMADLVRAGKIRYYALSNVPAWFAARARTIADVLGKDPPIALQLEYSLVNRHAEEEHLPSAAALGMAVFPYFPLAAGFLSGKYRRDAPAGAAKGRLDHPSQADHAAHLFSERNWRILDAVRSVAQSLGKTEAQIALNWVAHRPGVTAPLVGASTREQVDENADALDFSIPEDLRRRLDETSAPPL